MEDKYANVNLLQVSVNLVNMYVGILVGTCTKKYLDSVEKKSSLILLKTYKFNIISDPEYFFSLERLNYLLDTIGTKCRLPS